MAFPAFLTLIMIPLTYSIASGLGFGMIAYAGLRLIRGQFRKEDWLLYVLALLFLLRFIYMGRASGVGEHLGVYPLPLGFPLLLLVFSDLGG